MPCDQVDGFLDDIETRRVRDFEEGFYRYLDTEQAELMGQLATGAWDDDIIESLRGAAAEFKQSFTA